MSDVAERARRLGPLPFSAIGRRPPHEVPDLAPALAGRIDAWWDEAGQPDPWTIVEVGAGDGKRAAAMLRSGMRCLPATRYVTVEDDALLRSQQSARLPIESPILVLGPVGPPDGDTEDDPVRSATGIGPLVTSLGEPPVVGAPTALLAIDWLGRLPSDRFEWRHGQWWEIRLAAAGGDHLEEVAVLMDGPDQAAAGEIVEVERRVDGARYARFQDAVSWLAEMLSAAPAGRLAVIDRWTECTEALASDPAPGPALDQLVAVRKPVEAEPEELCPGWSVVSWKLG